MMAYLSANFMRAFAQHTMLGRWTRRNELVCGCGGGVGSAQRLAVLRSLRGSEAESAQP